MNTRIIPVRDLTVGMAIVEGKSRFAVVEVTPNDMGSERHVSVRDPKTMKIRNWRYNIPAMVEIAA